MANRFYSTKLKFEFYCIFFRPAYFRLTHFSCLIPVLFLNILAWDLKLGFSVEQYIHVLFNTKFIICNNRLLIQFFAKQNSYFFNFLSFQSDLRDFSPILKKLKGFNALKS